MFRKMRIAPRMALLIAVGAGAILGLVIGYNYFSARRLLEDELRLKARYLAQATACRIEVVEHAVEKVVQAAVYMLEETERPVPQRYAILEALVSGNKEIFGAAIAPWPRSTAPYVWRDQTSSNGLARSDLSAEGYRYEVWDWFTLPRDLKRAIWTEPYFDEGGGDVMMVTRAAPFHHPGLANDFAGVITSDVSLEWLRDMLAGLTVGRSGYAFLLSATGAFISHPVRDFIMNETIFSLAEERGDHALRALGQRIIRGETGFAPYQSLATGKSGWLAFAPVPSTGWSVGLFFPRDELLGVVFELNRKSLIFGIIGFALLLVVALGIARSITRPIHLLEGATRALATGNLDAPLPAIAGEDEIAGLATAFHSMRDDLKRHIAELRATTAAKERIESEIQIAHDIQMSLVPRTFPPFPDRNDTEIFGILEPARQIGGDFYDFFLADKDELCLVIGDVSGKGIPAALFMAVTRTFLQSIWRQEHNPGPTLTRLNRELAQDNKSCMFVTIFCARINLKTGRCVYANGGHNPPFFLRRGQPAQPLATIKGLVVGGMPDFTYNESEIVFAPGDAIFLYTDGVTEAMNPEGRLSGDNWALEQINRYSSGNCAEMVAAMRQALKNHTLDAEQSDDITMLAFRYLGA